MNVAPRVSSEAAAKILGHQGIEVSGDTLLNMLKEAGDRYEPDEATAIGVDDWA